MRYDPEKHRRRSIRLRGYDYRTPGAYFVTIVTQDRECLFGQIVEGTVHLNDAGRMVERWWHELNGKFPDVRTDAYVIMPNHFHGIIQILPHSSTQNGRGRPACLPANPEGTHPGEVAYTGTPLQDIVQWFKTMTTNAYIRGVKQQGWQPFNRRLWQRNYYEHIIRSEQEHERIRRYIETNPLRWQADPENPLQETRR